MKKKETDPQIEETMKQLEVHLDRIGVAKTSAARKTIRLSCQVIFIIGKNSGILQERDTWEKNVGKKIQATISKIEALKNGIVLRSTPVKGKA